MENIYLKFPTMEDKQEWLDYIKETGYNLIHNIEKLIKEGKDNKYNKETSTGK